MKLQGRGRAHEDSGRRPQDRGAVVSRDAAIASTRSVPPWPPGRPVPNGENRTEGEAWSALVALGYKPAEVTQMLKPFAGHAGSTEDLIRRALQGTVRPQ